MKTKLVDTVTNNDDHVRLRIFDGDLPTEQASAELLRLEREQHAHTRSRLAETQARLSEMIDNVAKALREAANPPAVAKKGPTEKWLPKGLCIPSPDGFGGYIMLTDLRSGDPIGSNTMEAYGGQPQPKSGADAPSWLVPQMRAVAKIKPAVDD